MTELLQKVDPQTIAIIGCIWLLREVFGWAKAFVSDLKEIKRGGPETTAEFLTGLESFKKISETLDAQIAVLRELAMDIREIKIKITRIEGDLDRLR